MRVVATVLLLVSGTGLAPAQSCTYFTFDPPGSTSTYVTGINNNGQIVGNYQDAAGAHYFLRTGSSFTNIEAPGASQTAAFGINNLGQIVGSYTIGGVSHGFVRSASGLTYTPFDAPDLGPAITFPTAINDKGEIVGTGFSAGSITTGFLRSADGQTFTTLQSGSYTAPRGITNDGMIAGTRWTPAAGDLSRGFVRSAAGAYTSVDVPGIEGNWIYGINNRGQVVGTVDNHGFVRNADGSFSILDVLGAVTTVAAAINDNGEVAGYYLLDGVIHGFLAVPTGNQRPAIRSVKGVMSVFAYGGFGAIAPATWIEIYGEHLAAGAHQWAAGDFTGDSAPLSLGGVTVRINGRPAPIYYVSPGQVNAQVPSSTALGDANVTITSGAQISGAYSIPVNSTQPGLLSIPEYKVFNTRYAIALFPDNITYVQAPALSPSVPSRPAKAGDTITLYGIGFGPVTPDIAAGQIASQLNRLLSDLQVAINGVPAKVVYAGLAPGYVGLYQINVEIPAGIPSGQRAGVASLTFTLGGVPGTQALFLSVE